MTVTHKTHGVLKTEHITRHIVVIFNGETRIPLKLFDAESGTALLACALDLTPRRVVDGSCR